MGKEGVGLLWLTGPASIDWGACCLRQALVPGPVTCVLLASQGRRLSLTQRLGRGLRRGCEASCQLAPGCKS